MWWRALWSTSKSPRVNFNAVSAVTSTRERERIVDEPIKFIIFAGKAEQVDVSKRDPRVDVVICQTIVPSVIRNSYPIVFTCSSEVWNVYLYRCVSKFETVWNCLKNPSRWLDGYCIGCYYYLYNVYGAWIASQKCWNIFLCKNFRSRSLLLTKDSVGCMCRSSTNKSEQYISKKLNVFLFVELHREQRIRCTILVLILFWKRLLMIIL